MSLAADSTECSKALLQPTTQTEPDNTYGSLLITKTTSRDSQEGKTRQWRTRNYPFPYSLPPHSIRYEESATMHGLLNRMSLFFLHNVRDFCILHRSEEVKDRSVNYRDFVLAFCSRFILEVCGAAGALWGCSEIVKLRSEENNDTIWRPIAITVFAIFSLRFWWHMKHYLERALPEFPPIKEEHRRRHLLPFFQIFGSKFLLQVLGSAGAVWGSSEALTLRTTETVNDWRLVSKVVGCIFLIRWFFEIMSYCLVMSDESLPFLRDICLWIEIVVVKFVLEVLGACGAVWGFSEIVKYRTLDTLEQWRLVALVVGGIFGLRWIAQIIGFIRERGSQRRELQEDGVEVGDLTLTEIDA